MGDWMQLSKADEAKFRSCRKDESILLLDGEWRKMPKGLIYQIMGWAYMDAIADAFERAGIDCTVTRGTGESGQGVRLRPAAPLQDVDFDHDYESETVMAAVRLDDGRTLQGFARLKRPGPH